MFHTSRWFLLLSVIRSCYIYITRVLISAEPCWSTTQVELCWAPMTISPTVENISLNPLPWGRPMCGTINEVDTHTHIQLKVKASKKKKKKYNFFFFFISVIDYFCFCFMLFQLLLHWKNKSILACLPCSSPTAKEAFEKGSNPIIIDNTNMQGWEMRPYVAQVSHLSNKKLRHCKCAKALKSTCWLNIMQSNFNIQ